METKPICGVQFANADVRDIAEAVAQRCHSERQGYLVTPNPEIVLRMWRDTEFKRVVERAWLRVVDGFGLQWADWFGQKFGRWPRILKTAVLFPSLFWFGGRRPTKGVIERSTGVDLMEKLLVHYQELPVFLLGAAPGVAEQVVKNYPFANIVGTYAGNPLPKYDQQLVERINQTEAKLLFVAYGAPKQELWLARNLEKLTQIKVGIGVGGAFDYLAGQVSRAPLLLRKLGLEWCYRLVKQPWRWQRIWRAVVVFPIKFIGNC